MSAVAAAFFESGYGREESDEAFGESCRDSGHGFSSLFDPSRPQSVHRSIHESSNCFGAGADAGWNLLLPFDGAHPHLTLTGL
jgi:hypothetical protein